MFFCDIYPNLPKDYTTICPKGNKKTRELFTCSRVIAYLKISA